MLFLFYVWKFSIAVVWTKTPSCTTKRMIVTFTSFLLSVISSPHHPSALFFIWHTSIWTRFNPPNKKGNTFFPTKQNLQQQWRTYFRPFFLSEFRTCPQKGKRKVLLAESGFDPPTCELWARHASPAPLRFLHTNATQAGVYVPRMFLVGQEGYYLFVCPQKHIGVRATQCT